MSIDFSKGCAIAYGMVDFEYLFKLYTTTINLDLDENQINKRGSNRKSLLDEKDYIFDILNELKN